METTLGINKWDLEAWIVPLGSMPLERIAHEDLSRSYEMCVAHVFRLESGKYALVTEEGCSCYSSEQADIELFPDKNTALEAFEKWKKQNAND
jgi:hypothetical protein